MHTTRLFLLSAFVIASAACSRPADREVAAAVEPSPAAQPESTAAAMRGDPPLPADAPPLATPATLNFYANGFSPAWRVEGAGETLKIDVPEHRRANPGYTTVTASHSKDGSFEIYSGQDGATEYTLTLDGKALCNVAGDENGRRGREFEAILTYGATVYKGCADRR